MMFSLASTTHRSRPKSAPPEAPPILALTGGSFRCLFGCTSKPATAAGDQRGEPLKILEVNIDWVEDTPNQPHFRLLVDNIDPEMLISPYPLYVYPGRSHVALTDNPDSFPEKLNMVLVDPLWLSEELKPFNYNITFTESGWVPYDPENLKQWIDVYDRNEGLAIAMRTLERIVWGMASADPDSVVRERMRAFARDIAKYWTEPMAEAPGNQKASDTYSKCQICKKRIVRQVFKQIPILKDGPIHPSNRIIGHPTCCRAYKEGEEWTLPVRKNLEWLAGLFFSYELDIAARQERNSHDASINNQIDFGRNHQSQPDKLTEAEHENR